MANVNDVASRSAGSDGRRWLALAVLSLSMLITVVDTTIVNVALPTLAARLHASASSLEWIVDAYTLSFAALLLPAGSAGDRFGRHRALAGVTFMLTQIYQFILGYSPLGPSRWPSPFRRAPGWPHALASALR